MNRRRPPDKSMGDVIVQIAIPIFMFIGGGLIFGFNTANGIATKPYVDDRFAESRRYTDEKAAQTLKEAFEHSDANRREMAIAQEQFKTEVITKIDTINTEFKTANAETKTKSDLMLRALQEMRDAAWSKVQKGPK